MEGFTYVDIFATKGVEYLLVLGYLVIFVLFMRALFGRGGAINKGPREKVDDPRKKDG